MLFRSLLAQITDWSRSCFSVHPERYPGGTKKRRTVSCGFGDVLLWKVFIVFLIEKRKLFVFWWENDKF